MADLRHHEGQEHHTSFPELPTSQPPKSRGQRKATYYLQALDSEEGVLVRPRSSHDGLAICDADLPWVCEQHPDRVERDCEEVPEEQNW